MPAKGGDLGALDPGFALQLKPWPGFKPIKSDIVNDGRVLGRSDATSPRPLDCYRPSSSPPSGVLAQALVGRVLSKARVCLHDEIEALPQFGRAKWLICDDRRQ